MTSKAKREQVLARLERAHQEYHDIAQGECETVSFMAANGHPGADDYRTLRVAYDQLRFASNHSRRLVAYASDGEQAEMHRPGLEIDREPRGWGDHWLTHRSTPEEYRRYLEDAAAAGWPAELKPSVECGFTVVTRDWRLVADLFTICEAGLEIVRPPRGEPWRVNIYKWSIDGGQALRILAAIRRRMRRALLPKRTAADDAWDAAPLDLANKRLVLCGGDRVTVTATQVQVPLVPPGDDGFLSSVADSLIGLCRRGYPWAGPVREWMAKWYAPAVMKTFDREFGGRGGVPLPSRGGRPRLPRSDRPDPQEPGP